MIKAIRTLDQLAWRIALFILLAGGTGYAYSWAEGYVDPVMEPLTIFNVRQGPTEFEVTFDGSATKLRNCVWISSRWWVGERFGSSVRTSWAYAGPPLVRGAGDLTWENQTVLMSPQQLYQHSHADVVHKCPWRLWNTVTPFYDSDPDTPLPELGPPVVSDLQRQIDRLSTELEQLK